MNPATRKKRDPSKLTPKRPLSAYNMFFQQERRGVQAQLFEALGRKATNKEVTQKVGEKWKLIPSSQRAHFELLAAKEKQRYALEVIKMKQSEDEGRKKSAKTQDSRPSVHVGERSQPGTSATSEPPYSSSHGAVAAILPFHQHHRTSISASALSLPLHPAAQSLPGVPHHGHANDMDMDAVDEPMLFPAHAYTKKSTRAGHAQKSDEIHHDVLRQGTQMTDKLHTNTSPAAAAAAVSDFYGNNFFTGSPLRVFPPSFTMDQDDTNNRQGDMPQRRKMADLSSEQHAHVDEQGDYVPKEGAKNTMVGDVIMSNDALRDSRGEEDNVSEINEADASFLQELYTGDKDDNDSDSVC